MIIIIGVAAFILFYEEKKTSTSSFCFLLGRRWPSAIICLHLILDTWRMRYVDENFVIFSLVSMSRYSKVRTKTNTLAHSIYHLVAPLCPHIEAYFTVYTNTVTFVAPFRVCDCLCVYACSRSHWNSENLFQSMFVWVLSYRCALTVFVLFIAPFTTWSHHIRSTNRTRIHTQTHARDHSISHR